jgi:hypothetical protein
LLISLLHVFNKYLLNHRYLKGVTHWLKCICKNLGKLFTHTWHRFLDIWKQKSDFCFFFFFGSTVVWTQSLIILGRRPTAWATPPALFPPVILEIGVSFLPRPTWMFSYFTLLTVARTAGATKPSLFSVEMVSSKIFS